MSWLQKIFNFRQTRRSRPMPSADPVEEQHDSDVVKPFLEHLEDLRSTLFKMVATITVGMIIAFCYRSELMLLVKAPLQPLGIQMYTLGMVTPFMLSIKLAFYAGIVISFPILLYFAAEFVLPALTRREKRLLVPGILIGFLLFGFGVTVAYLYVLPKTMQWLASYNADMQMATDRVEAMDHFKLVTHLTLACGLLCELPIVVIALSLLGVVSHKLLVNTRSYAMTLMLILVAIISPTPDPITFITLALPVLAIYELCIWIVWLIERRKLVS